MNKDFLFNIDTGKPSKQEISKFLMNVDKISKKAWEDITN